MKIGVQPSAYATAMDTAGSWGVEFLRCIGKEEDALSSQAYAATVLRTTSFDTNNPAKALVEGYGDIAGPWTMTVEFGAQGAAAGILDSNYIMQQIYLLEAPDGSFPGSTDNWFGGTVAPWTTKWTGVAPTAWVYFAQNGDPLLDLCCREKLIAVYSNKSFYTTRDDLKLYVSVNNQGKEIIADAFMGLVLPDDGSLYFFDPAFSNLIPAKVNDPKTWTPVRTSLPIPEGYTLPPTEVFSGKLPQISEGNYIAFAALAEPGSAPAGLPRIIGEVCLAYISFRK